MARQHLAPHHRRTENNTHLNRNRCNENGRLTFFPHIAFRHFFGHWLDQNGVHIAMKNGSVRCRWHVACVSFFPPPFCICATKIAQNIHHYKQNNWFSFQITVKSRHNFLDSIFFLLPSFRRSSAIFSILLLFVSGCTANYYLLLNVTERHNTFTFQIEYDNRPCTKLRQFNNRPATAPEWQKKGRIEEGEESGVWKIDCVRAREKNRENQTQRRNARSSIEMKTSNKTAEEKFTNKINIYRNGQQKKKKWEKKSRDQTPNIGTATAAAAADAIIRSAHDSISSSLAAAAINIMLHTVRKLMLRWKNAKCEKKTREINCVPSTNESSYIIKRIVFAQSQMEWSPGDPEREREGYIIVYTLHCSIVAENFFVLVDGITSAHVPFSSPSLPLPSRSIGRHIHFFCSLLLLHCIVDSLLSAPHTIERSFLYI